MKVQFIEINFIKNNIKTISSIANILKNKFLKHSLTFNLGQCQKHNIMNK